MKNHLRLVAWILLAVLLGGASLFAGYRAYAEYSRNKRISEEIAVLQDEAYQIDQENGKLRDRIEYLQSDSFREQEAKRVLEYRKIGEKVVFIRDQSDHGSLTQENSSARSEISDDSGAEEGPHYVKWWSLFFGTH